MNYEWKNSIQEISILLDQFSANLNGDPQSKEIEVILQSMLEQRDSSSQISQQLFFSCIRKKIKTIFANYEYMKNNYKSLIDQNSELQGELREVKQELERVWVKNRDL